MLNFYCHSPALPYELHAMRDQRDRLYLQLAALPHGDPERRELTKVIWRLHRRIKQTEGRYTFDHTVPGNWLIFVAGTTLMIAMFAVLNAMS